MKTMCGIMLLCAVAVGLGRSWTMSLIFVILAILFALGALTERGGK